ncbi:MAG TPA: NAD(P)H-dependent oxidoreductase [Clostridia bacterium]|nr:NAD(P)H-dependent oxidoreductase [Clostridia bacterium]
MRQEIVLISASPRVTADAASAQFVEMASKRLKDENTETTIIDVRRSFSRENTREDFEVITWANAIVIAFPLYFFCLPGMLTRFLEDYRDYLLETGNRNLHPKIYAIVNCGSPEAGMNEEAVRVVRSFSLQIKAEFRFGIMIGGGMLIGTKDAPFMKKNLSSLNDAFSSLKQDILNDGRSFLVNHLINPNFPRKLYLYLGNRRLIHAARKNGLNKKDLHCRPYQSDARNK